ncbi:FtsX-like permease family protein [Streptomyces sp. URMC 123]|uniref:FtsX-like permease family protein n=1 Tax=Streptomyces sp. URMC 123 TaxID=3423403 RepID=UPI003F1E1B96
MQRILLAKTRRELRRRLAQFGAIAVTVMLGVLLFVASHDAYRNLGASYDRTYARLNFADVTATGGATETVAAAVERAAGVAGVTRRTQADVPVTIGDDKLMGRVVGLPPEGRPAVDRVDVTSGRPLDPEDPGGVLVERHAAKTFGLTPGERFRAFDGEAFRELTVRGVVDSPEYLWPARSRQDVLIDPHSFAVFFAPEPTARALAGGKGPNQTLVALTPAAREAGAVDRIVERLRSAGAVEVERRADQASHATLQQDLKGFSGIAVAFPALFLGAAAVGAYVLITRLVLAERKVIGTLLAAGSRRGHVVRHYLGYGVITGVVGAALGVALGALATSAVTHAYTSALGIPDTVVRNQPATLLLGLAFGAVVGLLAAAAPAIGAARVAPAEAMRGEGARLPRPGPWGWAVARAHWLPVTWRMALRDLTRSRRRTLATMTGTVLALVLVLTSTGMITTMRSMLDLQYDRIQREDATVTVDPRVRDVERTLRGTEGVAAVEPVTTARVVAARGDHAYPSTLSGLRADTAMHRFRTPEGTWRTLPEDGILAGSALAERLRMSVGQTLTVAAPGGGPREVRLAGLLDEPVGTELYGTEETVRAAIGGSTNTYLLRFRDGVGAAERDELRSVVTRLEGVVAYTDERALRDQIDEYLNLFWIFVGVMLVLGGLLAFTVIFVTMTVNVAERTTELATLRASGVRLRRVAGALAAENLTATVLAAPVGLVAGGFAAWGFLRLFDNDLFSLDLTFGWAAPLAAAVAVLVAAALSQVPAVRMVGRMDIARVVRERAQ